MVRAETNFQSKLLKRCDRHQKMATVCEDNFGLFYVCCSMTNRQMNLFNFLDLCGVSFLLLLFLLFGNVFSFQDFLEVGF